MDDYDELLLKEKEQHYITSLNPSLNMRNAYITAQERYENQKKLWTYRNSLDLICECGCKIKKTHIARHKKTKKHKNIMIEKKIIELKDLLGCKNLSIKSDDKELI